MPPPDGESPTEIKRKRLLYRSWNRGTRESDLLMGPFAERYIREFDEAALDLYAALLERSDPDIYNWISGREEPPADIDNRVTRLLIETAVELRAAREAQGG